ncbi:hypothetical protein WR25_23906 [Diploscapter pachys]|uniref:NADH dehydrogenase [ubiquinone] 1 alpha subcomplex subunit 2 n=1 Tax=Diploscapter pachys TaxID=2018661 RepID=A0A2A2KZ66_9BILA|nr:hypothetical protein WR25_23906 [Diploscapter pachys]
MSSQTIRLAGTALRELRVHFCQLSPASAGVRDFIANDYVPMKKANPDVPILIREASGIVPRIWARYEHGVEKNVEVLDYSREKVTDAIRQLANAK